MTAFIANALCGFLLAFATNSCSLRGLHDNDRSATLHRTVGNLRVVRSSGICRGTAVCRHTAFSKAR